MSRGLKGNQSIRRLSGGRVRGFTTSSYQNGRHNREEDLGDGIHASRIIPTALVLKDQTILTGSTCTNGGCRCKKLFAMLDCGAYWGEKRGEKQRKHPYRGHCSRTDRQPLTRTRIALILAQERFIQRGVLGMDECGGGDKAGKDLLP